MLERPRLAQNDGPLAHGTHLPDHEKYARAVDEKLASMLCLLVLVTKESASYPPAAPDLCDYSCCGRLALPVVAVQGARLTPLIADLSVLASGGAGLFTRVHNVSS